jgi:hypothetical protein
MSSVEGYAALFGAKAVVLAVLGELAGLRCSRFAAHQRRIALLSVGFALGYGVREWVSRQKPEADR